MSDDGGRLTLRIVTPNREYPEQRAAYVILPSSEGYLGVLPRHAPLITALKPGIVSYKTKDQEKVSLIGDGTVADRQIFAVSGGFAEVSSDTITVLADTAERADEIDTQRAREALRRAEMRLENKEQDVDVARARAALERAIARLQAVGAEEAER